MPNVLELLERRASLTTRMHEVIDGAEGEDRDLTQEELNNLNEMEAEFNSLDSRIERQRKLEATPAPPEKVTLIKPDGRNADIGQDEYRAAFSEWAKLGDRMSQESRSILSVTDVPQGAALTFRMGDPGIHSAKERRDLATVSLTAGGATVPINNTFASRLEVAMSWFGGMREVATIFTTDDGADLPFPTANDTSNTGEITAENGAFTLDVDPTFAAVVYKAYKYDSNVVQVPWELLQDSAIDISGQLAQWLGERIARVQNTHFTNGVGGNQPTGITLDSVQGRAGATGTATSVTWDDLILLEHSINKSYRDRGRYMFHDQTLRDLRRIKNGNGDYIWQPAVTANAPSLINGFPYTINNDVAVMAASVNSILFGDLSKYYIRQVRDVVIIRLNELYARNGQVGFLAWARADGKLIDAGTNPVKHFTNSAS